MIGSLAHTKSLTCLVCNAPNPDPDHIKSRGAGGGDEPENVWPLCRQHHTERHASGLTTFVERHGLGAILIFKGWEFDALRRRWFRPKAE